MMTYDGRLLTTTWKPVLPAGWTISNQTYTGQGFIAETVGAGVLIIPSSQTAELPNPLTFTYTVQAPVSAIGTVSLDCKAKLTLEGLINPLIVPASQGLQVAPKLDTNGLGSGWEKAYGIAAGTDSSTMGANGYTLEQSYQGGFNPNVVNSVLVIQGFDVANGMISLSWQSEAIDRTYTVESAETPAGPFVPVPTATGIASTPPQNSMKLEFGTCGPFIRVVVDPTP